MELLKTQKNKLRTGFKDGGVVSVSVWYSLQFTSLHVWYFLSYDSLTTSVDDKVELSCLSSFFVFSVFLLRRLFGMVLEKLYIAEVQKVRHDVFQFIYQRTCFCMIYLQAILNSSFFYRCLVLQKGKFVPLE